MQKAECKMQNDGRVNGELRRVAGCGCARINFESARALAHSKTLREFCERLGLSGSE